MKKPAIPGTSNLTPALARVIEPIKANIEMLTGARPGVPEIEPLGDAATLADVVAKLNEVISRINQSG